MSVYRMLHTRVFGEPKNRDCVRMTVVHPNEVNDVPEDMSVVLRQHAKVAATQTFMPSIWVQFMSDKHIPEHPVQAMVFASGNAFRHCPKCNPEACVMVPAESFVETSMALDAITGLMAMSLKAVIHAKTKRIKETEVVA